MFTDDITPSGLQMPKGQTKGEIYRMEERKKENRLEKTRKLLGM